MLRGLPASIIVHAAVLSASYLTWPYWGRSSSAYITNVEAVDVNFAEIGEITDIAPLIRQDPEEEEAAPEPPEEEIIEEEPVEEDLPEAEIDVTNTDEAPAPEVDPDELLPDFEAEPEEQPEKEPEPKKDPDPTPRPPRDPLADFLNQSESTFKSEIETQRKRPDPTPPPRETTTALKDAPQPAETRDRRGAGDRQANVARIDAILYSRIYPCWDGVSDLPFPEKLNVRMKLELNRNGTIADLSLIEPTRRPIGSSPMGTAVDRALRAVRKCAPFALPDDDYEIWREGTVNLGPAFTPTSQR